MFHLKFRENTDALFKIPIETEPQFSDVFAPAVFKFEFRVEMGLPCGMPTRGVRA